MADAEVGLWMAVDGGNSSYEPVTLFTDQSKSFVSSVSDKFSPRRR